MNGLENRATAEEGELLLIIHFVDGDSLEQSVTVEEAEVVQGFIEWFRSPGRYPVHSLHFPLEGKIKLLRHSNITAVEIEGYIEPEGRDSRWYERMLHKYKAWRVSRALSRGGGRKHGNCQ